MHSARFDALFKYHSPAIQGFQIRQDANGALTVLLELNPRSTPAEVDVPGLHRKIQELVEGYPAALEVVEFIPQTTSGQAPHRDITTGSRAR